MIVTKRMKSGRKHLVGSICFNAVRAELPFQVDSAHFLKEGVLSVAPEALLAIQFDFIEVD